MAVVKRLHLFVLKSFLPLFAMTFFIVLFIVLMQFLWKYIDDLVGKGLSLDVLAELFFYAAVSMIPMALPLAILLASLMTFGNLGEKFELTAMKASGISLIRVMAPLIVLVSGVAVGAFFFQNDVLPKAQVKMWTLLFSMRQKSPEVEIPEGVFYDQIPGYNLLVQSKNKETGMLYDVMIYDVSQGGDNSTILLSDSARLAFTGDMQHLYLKLYKGEQFENLREQSNLDQNVPFRREEFYDKEILIPFDANFNRMDDGAMRKQYVGKNIAELRHTIDSVGSRLDSIGRNNRSTVLIQSMGSIAPDKNTPRGVTRFSPVTYSPKQLRFDTLFNRASKQDMRSSYNRALQQISSARSQNEFKAMMTSDEKRTIRRHEIELIKKFTLSVACLIFFFIGAPLGAIIRKGGIGTPLVISVLLFLVYYIIDNTGYKMGRDGRWPVPVGMWLSTAILAPLGIYVTIKAMNDSAVFDKDAYLNFFRRLFGRKVKRHVEFKEVIINDISLDVAIERLTYIREICSGFLVRYQSPQGYVGYLTKGYDLSEITLLSDHLEDTVDYLCDCRDVRVVRKLTEYPVIRSKHIYHPFGKRWLGYAAAVIFPVGIPLWLCGIRAQSKLKDSMRTTYVISGDIEKLLNEDADIESVTLATERI